MINIKYDSDFNNVTEKIIKEIIEKLKGCIIFNGDISKELDDKENNLLNIDYFDEIIKRDNPLNYRKPFHLFNYEDMIKMIKKQNENKLQRYRITTKTPEKYLYIQLTIEKETMNEYIKLNKYENEFSINMLNNNGLYIEKMNDINNRYLLVGVKKELLENTIDSEKLNPLGVDIDNNTKCNDIANAILENVSQKLVKYNIYNKDKLQHDKLNRLQIIEDEDYDISKKPIDLFIYDDMIERLDLAGWDKNCIDFEYNDKYLYTILCIKKEITDDYDKFDYIEKELINNFLYSKGIYFKRILKGKYTMVGINLNIIK